MNRLKFTKFAVIAVTFMISTKTFSQDFSSSFNSNLSANEISKLKRGEVLIRNLESTENICLSADNAYAKRFLTEIKNIKPSYLAEVIQVLPYEEHKNLVQELSSLVGDIKSYTKIPYYTVRNGAWAAMFTKAEVVSTGKENMGKFSNVVFEMPPFEQFDAKVVTISSSNALYFATINTDIIKYKLFKAVQPEKMECGLVLFRSGDYWILYGSGAIKPDAAFFIKSRVNTAFVNRVKDFSMYFIKQLH